MERERRGEEEEKWNRAKKGSRDKRGKGKINVDLLIYARGGRQPPDNHKCGVPACGPEPRSATRSRPPPGFGKGGGGVVLGFMYLCSDTGCPEWF